MNINLDIAAFAKKYREKYQWLYEGGDKLSQYRELVETFDSFLKGHAEFVGEFCRYIGDLISSDREAAAFALTLSDFIL